MKSYLLQVTQNNLTAFGAPTDHSSLTTDHFFTGKPHVGEMGYVFLFRAYCADQGKWQTSDPLGYPDGWNNFAYVNNGITAAFDYLGGYRIEWEGTWGVSEKTAIQTAFSQISATCSIRIFEIDSILNDLNLKQLACPHHSNHWTELIMNVWNVKRLLENVVNGIASTTINLELYQSPYSTRYAYAVVPDYPLIRDRELHIGVSSAYNWFVSKSTRVIFHELLHFYGTGDHSDIPPPSRWNDSWELEYLMDTSLTSIPVYRDTIRKIICE